MGPAARRKVDLEQKVLRVVDEALELAGLGGRRTDAESIAERIFESESDLMREAWPRWAVERLTWMINRRRRDRWREAHPAQMMLPDPVFENLPSRVFLRDGHRPRLDHCTVGQVEDHLKVLRERLKSHPRIAQMEAVVQLHRKWSAREHGITWADAQRREAEQRAK